MIAIIEASCTCDQCKTCAQQPSIHSHRLAGDVGENKHQITEDQFRTHCHQYYVFCFRVFIILRKLFSVVSNKSIWHELEEGQAVWYTSIQMWSAAGVIRTRPSQRRICPRWQASEESSIQQLSERAHAKNETSLTARLYW